MNKDVLVRAVYLDFEDKLNKVTKDIENCNDFIEMAGLYKLTAEYCLEIDGRLKKIEESGCL